MDKRVITALVMLASGAARAERIAAAKPDSSRHRTSVVDLDLSMGLEREPALATGDAPAPRATWYYWAAAGAAVAAGGLGLYWYEDRSRTQGLARRNDQVFTDEQ